jgi:hypothetical protein
VLRDQMAFSSDGFGVLQSTLQMPVVLCKWAMASGLESAALQFSSLLEAS